MFEHPESPPDREIVENSKLENPDFSTKDTTGVKKEPYSPENYRNTKERVAQAELRENFLRFAESYERDLGEVKVNVAGEEYALRFKNFTHEGAPQKSTEDLMAKVEKKENFDMRKVAANLTLVSIKGRPEPLTLNFNVPLNKIITGDVRGTLVSFITGTFAGTDNYYRRIRAVTEGTEKAPAAHATHATHERVPNEKSSKAAAALKKILSDRAGGREDVSLLEGNGIMSVIVSVASQEKQVHFTTTGDKSSWHVFQTEKGQKTFEQTGLKPEEMLKFAETVL